MRVFYFLNNECLIICTFQRIAEELTTKPQCNRTQILFSGHNSEFVLKLLRFYINDSWKSSVPARLHRARNQPKQSRHETYRYTFDFVNTHPLEKCRVSYLTEHNFVTVTRKCETRSQFYDAYIIFLHA